MSKKNINQSIPMILIPKNYVGSDKIRTPYAFYLQCKFNRITKHRFFKTKPSLSAYTELQFNHAQMKINVST